MKISKIGAKVKSCKVTFVQSSHKGSFFFLTQDYDFYYENLISKFPFVSLLSMHSKVYGHDILYTM